jgi:ABC-type multidrug transport system fused ATPase/permease subunit
VPIVLVVAFGVGNIIDAGFQQLRDVLFASVGQHAVRKLALQTFEHLHKLSLRFHLARRTGGLSRVIERGTKGIETIVRFTMLNTAPTLVEFVITGVIFIVMFGISYLERAGGDRLALSVVHHQGLELAHRHPSRHERQRHRCQRQGHRQPAQLRDGEILRQREDGGPALRCLDGEI